MTCPPLEPQNHPVIQHAPDGVGSPTLEGLPADLRTAVLLIMPDLATLSRLVHASPVFHAQYLLHRKSILFQALLKETTEDVFVDVYAAFSSHPSRIGPPTEPNTNVTDFLSSYLAWRLSCITPRQIFEKCSFEEIRSMASFHQSTVSPLATQFVCWALANYRSGPAPRIAQPQPLGGEEEALTRTEKTRVMRACYRFETLCHLFCDSHYEKFGRVDINELIFCNLGLEPWEAEEVCTIYAFVKAKYEEVVQDVEWDLNEHDPKFDDQDESELEGLVFPLDEEYDGNFNRHKYYVAGADFLTGTIAHGGLDLALKMIKAVTHDERLDLMTRSLQAGGDSGDFVEEATDPATHVSRRYRQPNDRDRAEERDQAMSFAGDDAGAPPLAWTLLWGGRYSNLFGGYVPDELRRWGYVLWDARRIDVDGARGYLKGLWATSPELMLVCRQWAWMSDRPRYLD
ncbi:hypothetical protein KVR01_002421 [Diaporthe batatas]|uniref:uncharacterized protein n=1 Tax=Diaporthe batatas TaxID=748121 RepID=UPI001D03EFD2|nr:uncharacterized protein KVR01_002421 [Diaporthe batatas]KAG8166732.1 hypothetical protein KVR01_002421 [Diaporthe batatas]